MEFEWDDEEDVANQRKHGLSYAQAKQLFESGVDYLEIFDEEHSESEDRFIAIGPIEERLVVVIYTEPEEDVIRIISVRQVTRREQALYHTTMDPNS